MNTKSFHQHLVAVVVALSVFVLAASIALGQSSGFTYQGRLTDGGTAANGNYDLQFALWDSLSSGTQIGSTQSLSTVAVTSGVFTVSLDFGASSFPGASRFLEISARPSGSGSFTLLTPRQQVTSTPYALRSRNASAADALSSSCSGCVTDTNISAIAGSKITGTIPVNAVPAGSGNYIQNTSSAQIANFNISGNGTVGGTLTAVGNEILSTGAQSGFKFRDRGSNSSADDWVWYSIGNIARLFRAGAGDLLSVGTAGNVGVGTVSPQAKLDVRGDVKLGSTGQFFAPAGEENLRIIRGNIFGDGTIAAGSGFTVSSINKGVFYITFNTPFSGTPAVTATAERFGSDVIVAEVDPDCGCDRTKQVKIVIVDTFDGNGVELPFLFIAVGPR